LFGSALAERNRCTFVWQAEAQEPLESWDGIVTGSSKV